MRIMKTPSGGEPNACDAGRIEQITCQGNMQPCGTHEVMEMQES